MKKGEKKEFQKGELKIVATYSGEYVLYETDFGDPEYDDGRDLFAQEIEEIEIFFPGITKPIRLSEYLSNTVSFVESPELGDGYHELNGRYISFKSLTDQGGLLGILHEMGHAEVDERYDAEDYENSKRLREKHAWGWALLLFKELKRQGMNLEPNMDEIGIKNFIKDSLLSHEILSRTREFLRGDTVQEKGYWSKSKAEDIDRVADELYNLPNSNLKDSFSNISEFQRAIRLSK